MILKNFRHMVQAKPGDCGFMSLAMVISYLERDIAPEQITRPLFSKIYKKGILLEGFINALKRYLPNHSVRYLNVPKDKFANILKKQITAGIPVPFIYPLRFKSNPDRWGLHYSVVIGFDEDSKAVEIADPAGDEAENNVKLDMLHEKMSLSETGRGNFAHRATLFFLRLIYGRNIIFLIEPKT